MQCQTQGVERAAWAAVVDMERVVETLAAMAAATATVAVMAAVAAVNQSIGIRC